MNYYAFLFIMIFTIKVYGQDENQKYSLKGIKEIGIEVNLSIDDYSSNSVIIDKSIFIQELRYYLTTSRIKNKQITTYEGNKPYLLLDVKFRESRGEIDIISEIRLLQKLSFPNSKMKLYCVTWAGNNSIIYLREKWNYYYQEILLKSITDNVKMFISDFKEVNDR